MNLSGGDAGADIGGNWPLFSVYLAFAALLNGAMLLLMIWLFNVRWRVSG